ncbi:MAG: hypothetical protein ACP5E5_12085 [Acidobacteriaceae bacterium]
MRRLTLFQLNLRIAAPPGLPLLPEHKRNGSKAENRCRKDITLPFDSFARQCIRRDYGSTLRNGIGATAWFVDVTRDWQVAAGAYES